jgi:CheY-like chemotaxis protein
MGTEQVKILCIDDSRDMVASMVALLTADGFAVFPAYAPRAGVEMAQKVLPDLIFLDIMMPEMDGYEVCRLLQKDKRTAGIPVVFISALTQPQNKVSALSVGGVDYLTKPFTREELRAITRKYAGKKAAVAAAPVPAQVSAKAAVPGGRRTLADFKKNVIDGFALDAAGISALSPLQGGDIYKLSEILGISQGRVARLLSDFTGRPYLPVINPQDVNKELLPAKFSEQNNIAAVNTASGGALLVMSQPFDLELQDMIRGIMGGEFDFGITEPGNISVLYKMVLEHDTHPQKIPGGGAMALEEAAINRLRAAAKSAKNEINEPHVKYLTGKILQFLAEEKTASARIEVNGSGYLVAVGAAGTMTEFTRLNRMAGNMVTARLKAMAGMNVLERNTPQNGSFVILCGMDPYKLNLRTEPSDLGENLVLAPAG